MVSSAFRPEIPTSWCVFDDVVDVPSYKKESAITQSISLNAFTCYIYFVLATANAYRK